MSKYLITPSLLSSYNWYISAEYGDPAELRKDWLQRLARVQTPMSEAAQKGIDFENRVRELIENKPTILANQKPEYIECVINIANRVRSGYWQETLKKEIEFDGKNFLLYGKSDVIKEDTIYDIKTTKSYEVGKFQDNPQHAIYCYCADIYKFKYLVTDFKGVFEESYTLTKESALDFIHSLLSEFLAYLEVDIEARALYYKHWESKY
jgi:hypothetical protein